MLFYTNKIRQSDFRETVQHVTRDDMLDDNTAAQFEIFNIDINERLDDKKNCIRHGEG